MKMEINLPNGNEIYPLKHSSIFKHVYRKQAKKYTDFAAAESGAPGSLGTYSPGIPSPPVGRTTRISASSTALGCSVVPSPVVA